MKKPKKQRIMKVENPVENPRLSFSANIVNGQKLLSSQNRSTTDLRLGSIDASGMRNRLEN